MQYDWSGARTRRIQKLRAILYLIAGLAAVLGPVFLLPKLDISLLLAFMM